jgi:hypothetical protein
VNTEPRKITRYRNFSAAGVRIHPLKRLCGKIARFVPRRWRFFVLGLPPARAARKPRNLSGVDDPGIFRLPGGIACALGAHLDTGGAYQPEMTLGSGSFIETRFLQRQRLFPRISDVPGVVVSLVADGQMNYYRWLMETLPRFELLRRNEVKFDLLYCCQTMPFHRESMRALAGTAPLLPSEKNTFIRARELVVPDFVDESEPWIVPWLQKQFLPLAGSTKLATDKRIYITRRQATGRRVVNEADLLSRLEPLGFRPVILENLSFTDQISLFRQAEMIVAPHGAGLANLVFCSPPVVVIELIAEKYPFTFYPEICRRLLLQHHRVHCDPVDPARMRTSDLRVPVDNVMKVLSGLGPPG